MLGNNFLLLVPLVLSQVNEIIAGDNLLSFQCDDCYFNSSKGVVSLTCDPDKGWSDTRTVIIKNDDQVLFDSSFKSKNSYPFIDTIAGTRDNKTIFLKDNNWSTEIEGWNNLICLIKEGTYESRSPSLVIPLIYSAHLTHDQYVFPNIPFNIGCYLNVSPNMTQNYEFYLNGTKFAQLRDGNFTNFGSIKSLRVAQDPQRPTNGLILQTGNTNHFGKFQCKMEIRYLNRTMVLAAETTIKESVCHGGLKKHTTNFALGFLKFIVFCAVIMILFFTCGCASIFADVFCLCTPARF